MCCGKVTQYYGISMVYDMFPWHKCLIIFVGDQFCHIHQLLLASVPQQARGSVHFAVFCQHLVTIHRVLGLYVISALCCSTLAYLSLMFCLLLSTLLDSSEVPSPILGVRLGQPKFKPNCQHQLVHQILPSPCLWNK